MDASALNHDTFESWASEYGYDTDSRDAERIYKLCLDIGLKLRNRLGDKLLGELTDAAANHLAGGC